MNRTFVTATASLLVTLAISSATQAGDGFAVDKVYPAKPTQPQALQADGNCDEGDPWARFHSFLFRRYAGSVEMETKTKYPQSYFGRYTYRPWYPDWVNPQRNRRTGPPKSLVPQVISLEELPVQPHPLQLQQPAINQTLPHLHSVDVQPARP